MLETPWAVWCEVHDQVFLSREEYDRQMSAPDARWKCPACGRNAQWDDENYDKHTSHEED